MTWKPKKKKSTAIASMFSLKLFIKKVNSNNKYPKIIKYLLDKINGIVDAKSIFRLKGSRAVHTFSMKQLILTESTGKCIIWSFIQVKL